MLRTALAELVCPYTLAPLAVEATVTDGDEVVEAMLRAGDRGYPVTEGIPSFVPPELRDDQTVRSFEQKWQQHRYYRRHTGEFYRRWFLDRYRLGDVGELTAHKARVLDAGTGSGRDAVAFAQAGAGLVYGVDTARQALVNTAAELASEGAPKNLAFVHADVNMLPFPDGFFDVISCDQVIHHTPDPPATFKRLRTKLRTGGQMCVYVYRRKAAIRELADDYVRERVKHLPVEEALAACEGITKLGRAFAKLGATLDVEEDIEVLGIQAGRYDLQRFLHYNVLKCFWNDEFDFFTNNIVNYDWYHPTHCHRYQPAEFRAWFDEGWEILAWDEREAGTSCRARKI